MDRPRQQDVYHVNRREDVLPHVPPQVRSVLDVGCASGGFGLSLRTVVQPGAHVVGVEAMGDPVAVARASGAYDEVVEGYFPDALAGRADRFELIAFLDVLEHMLDPGEALDAAHDFLAPDGRILVSLPNVGYFPVVADLLRGRWDYTETGVLDRTHLRFYTRATMVELLAEHGYAVTTCVGINDGIQVWQSDPLPPRRWLKLGLRHLMGDRRYMQFVLVARSERAG